VWIFKAHIKGEHRVKTRAHSNYNYRRRSISSDRTPTEIRHFFMTKARRSESKASINYPCGPFKHTLSWNIVLKTAHSFSLYYNSVTEEAFGVAYLQVKIANNRYCCSSMGTSGSLKA